MKLWLFLFLPFFSPLFSVQVHAPSSIMVDEATAIVVTDLTPYQFITLELSYVDFNSIIWKSAAQFQADANGEIHVQNQAPLAGSYQGSDPMGLFWSMQMEHIASSSYRKEWQAPCQGFCIKNLLQVLNEEGEVLTEHAFCRYFRSREVQHIALREKDGFIGNFFFMPEREGEEFLPFVVILGGSEGGMPSSAAALLASKGFPTLALAYFGLPSLPPNLLAGVQLEYFEPVFEWIKQHPRFNGKIALVGVSRGAELALLLGCIFPEHFEKIVAVAPSSVVLSKNTWWYRGVPLLPAAPHLTDVNNDSIYLRNDPLSIRRNREEGMRFDSERYEAAKIPVELLGSSLLLIAGGDDQVSPSALYSQQILERLEQYNSKISRECLVYEKAGHLISFPYVTRPTVMYDKGAWINFGGSEEENAKACRFAWEYAIRFLQR